MLPPPDAFLPPDSSHSSHSSTSPGVPSAPATSLNRRHWLAGALALGLAPLAGRAASASATATTAGPSAYTPDGPAQRLPQALRAQMLDVALAGQRLVAVGERGIVLLSDDQGRQWRQAGQVPTRSTLTAVHATDERVLWAVGHGGLVLKSADAGETWQPAFGSAGGREVLLSVRVQADGLGLAVGGFGHALRTEDGGRHWAPVQLMPGEEGERHLNRIFVSPARTWLIACEGGGVLRSEDGGQHWTALRSGYTGSLWGGAAVGEGSLVVCGMRGHWARSLDDGRSWSAQAVPGAGSLTAVAALPGGGCALAGVDGTLATGAVHEGRFLLRPQADRSTLAALLPLSATLVVAASSQGMKRLELGAVH